MAKVIKFDGGLTLAKAIRSAGLSDASVESASRDDFLNALKHSERQQKGVELVSSRSIGQKAKP